VPAAAARALLGGQLPSLQRCSLEAAGASSGQGEAAQQVVIDAFPAGLQQLKLEADGSSVVVDAAGLATCSGLTSLELSVHAGTQLANITTAMGACQQLQRLYVSDVSDYGGRPQLSTDAAMEAVVRMPQLRSLGLPYVELDPQRWQRLVQGMPRLQELEIDQVQLDAASPPAPSSLTFLKVASSLGLPSGGPGAAAGSLVAVLPALQRLDVSGDVDVPRALLGHPQLTELCLRSGLDGGCSGAGWPQGLLSSMPRLRKLHFYEPPCPKLDELLADAAGCPQLEDLEVLIYMGDHQRGCLSGAGLAALAAGACAGSLRRLVLDTQLSAQHDCGEDFMLNEGVSFGMARAAPLLAPGALPALRELQLDVELPPPAAGRGRKRGGKRSHKAVAADVLKRAQQLLQGAGAAAVAAGLKVGDGRSQRSNVALPAGVPLEGRGAVEECVVRLNVWLSQADKEAYGIDDEGDGW
jgi:hypothetical protein